MGVDWYSCDLCEETFPDCGVYYYCDCGRHWCSLECAKEDGYECGEETFDEENGWYIDPDRSCKYCRGEEVDDCYLLEFLMNKHGYTRTDLIKEYNKTEENK